MGLLVLLGIHNFISLSGIVYRPLVYKYRTEDGHWVRSKAELIIDNWLYRGRIVHAYERRFFKKKRRVLGNILYLLRLSTNYNNNE